ncbi:thiamine pyrophosphate-dependent dehydrogenase E1 component subunit alpha [soil metagenome]
MTMVRADLLWMHEKMVLIRQYEDTLAVAYMEGKTPPHIQRGLSFDIGGGPIPGEMHLAAGQEPAAVGVGVHLRRSDTVWASHRSHHFAIAKGIDLDRMTAEIFGRVSGLSRGKGGHMHLYDPSCGFTSNGIVGAGIPHACGAALAAKLSGTDAVAIAEFGDGAANQGSFHEALNLAGLWKLPVVFVCQDNNYGISVTKAESTAVASNAIRAAGYGMPGVHVPVNDTLLMAEVAREAIVRARLGQGPTLIEIEVTRLQGHYQGDPQGYRPEEEMSGLAAVDPLPIFESQLLTCGISMGELEANRAAAHALVAKAMAFARGSDLPARSEVLEHVFAKCRSMPT